MKKNSSDQQAPKGKAFNAAFTENLIQALEMSKENNGVFLNAKGKGYPKIYDSSATVSPFNALMIALNSDRNDYLTNEITLYSHAHSRKEAVQGLEKGMPYTWYMWNCYVSNADPSKVLSAMRYDALPEQEKAGYTFTRRVRSSFTVFNIDQTTMPYVNKENYNAAVKENGSFEHRDNEIPAKADAKRRMAFNGDLKKISENMVHVTRSTTNLAYYNPRKDSIFLIPQQNYNSYHEYVSAVNRLLITATGHAQRLSREGVDSGTRVKISDASLLHESLVCELASAVRNLRYSLPSALSSTEHIEEWIEMLKQSPDYVEVLERDVNMSVDMLEKAVRGEKINLRSDATLANMESLDKGTEKEFSKIAMLKDDNGKWTLFMQPTEGESLAIHPDIEDVSLYFTTIKTKTDDVIEKVKSVMANKYYHLASADTSMCVDLFHKDAPGIELVNSINIFKGKSSGNGESPFLIRATIDGERQKVRYLSQENWYRMNLKSISETKQAFAAVIYSDVIEKKLKERATVGIEKSQSDTLFSSEKSLYSFIASVPDEQLRDDFIKFVEEGGEPSEALRVVVDGVSLSKEDINLSQIYSRYTFADANSVTSLQKCPDIVVEKTSQNRYVFYRKVSEQDIVTALTSNPDNNYSNSYVEDIKARLENPKIEKEMSSLQPTIETPIGETLSVRFGGKDGRNTLDAGVLTPTGFAFKQILRYDYSRSLTDNLKELEARVLAMPEYQKVHDYSFDVPMDSKKEPEYYATIAYLQDGESTLALSRLMEADKYEELLSAAAEYDDGDAINLEEVYKAPCHNRYDSLVDYNDHYAVVYNGSVGGTFEVLRRVTKEEVLATINRYGLPEKPSEEVLKLEAATKEESKGDTLSPMTNIHTIMDLQNIIEEFANTTCYKLEIRDNKLFYDGHLYLYETPITSLPDNLTVRKSLHLINTPITELPDNLKVGGDLDLTDTPITSLPDNLTVGGNLNLSGTEITELPEGLTVAGWLDLSGTPITSLPENLTVGKNLYLYETPITSLPDNLKVGGDLDLTETPITELPDNLTVGGKLYLRGTNFIDTSNIKHKISEDARRKIKEKQNICLTFVGKSQAEATEVKQTETATVEKHDEQKEMAQQEDKPSDQKEHTSEQREEKEEEEKEEKAVKAAISPILQQYLDLKKKHPDAILLFRCGDFYETYKDDAVKASNILGITLTKSNGYKDDEGKPLAMAGFPHHALDTYLPKLIRAGQRVAIYDHQEDPKKTFLDKKVIYKSVPFLVSSVRGNSLHLKYRYDSCDLIDISNVNASKVKKSTGEQMSFDKKVQKAAEEYKAKYDALSTEDRSITPSEKQKIINKSYEMRSKEIASYADLLKNPSVYNLTEEQVNSLAVAIGERQAIEKIEMELNSIVRENPERELLNKYSELKEKYPGNRVFLFENADGGYVAIQDDAITLSKLLELDTYKGKKVLKLSIPQDKYEDSLKKIMSSGYLVGVSNRQDLSIGEVSEKDCPFSIDVSSLEESSNRENIIKESEDRGSIKR